MIKIICLSFLILTFFFSPKVIAQSNNRSIEELTADISGNDILIKLVKNATNKVIVLLPDKTKAIEALIRTQVTTRSLMGAVVYFTGGILIDDGWIRLLGSGNDKMKRSLPFWNKGKTFENYGERPPYLLIGDDAVGGFFAVNGGGLGDDLGNVYYFAPETLQWQSLGRTYSEFLDFCVNGNLMLFYKNYRWRGWQKEVSQINGDEIFSFYPFLWSKEGKDINKTKRNVVPVQEYYDFTISSITQLKK